MIRGSTCILAAASATVVLAAVTPAHAELTLCNRTSYMMEIAYGLEKRANVSTYGWFRVDPGQCRKILDTPLEADLVYVHARTSPVYGSAPLPQNDESRFCVRDTAFAITDARNCPVSQQARFNAAKPSDTPNGPTINLAEEADYDDAQARLAGIQRLMAIAGYDAYPIDGVSGAKTQAALTKFLSDRKLPAEVAGKPEFFDALLTAAADPASAGFSWCNDTKYTVMASLGVVEMGAIVTRGWYRVPAGQCLRPDLRGDPHRLYSYAEAVDDSGRTVHQGDGLLSWGGNVPLCTRDGKFELSDHKDCAARGLNSADFTVIDTGDRPSTIVRFKEP
jgi:uncharacterized membrane protein